MSTSSPNDEQLVTALRILRTENPTLGTVKFHALLLKTYPEWSVSEKRFKKLLQQQHLQSVIATDNQQNTSTANMKGKVYPTSRMMDQLDVGQWTKKVEVKYFGKKKGKGLVATQMIEKGEIVWKEDPWIIAPEWDIFTAQEASLACSFCTTPLSGSRLVIPCPSMSGCSARFCNRLCYSRSALTHPLLCRAQNPAMGALLDLAKREQWMGLHALSHQTAKLLLANEKGSKAFQAQWNVVRGFAEMGMEDRARGIGNTPATRDHAAWKNAYKLYMQAFRNPTDPVSKKKYSRIIKQPLPSEVESHFSYEGFSEGLGRMNLNLEAHGGLYVLHSHLNHACDPNISVRHFDRQSALARITVIALKDIEPGTELVITYVDPSGDVRQRRRQLREWGFGECDCARCVKEAEKFFSGEIKTSIAEETQLSVEAKVDMVDLEKELREGFGV